MAGSIRLVMLATMKPGESTAATGDMCDDRFLATGLRKRLYRIRSG